MVRRIFLPAFILIAGFSTVIAQNTTGDVFSSEAIRQFKRWEQVPYEKLYLQLDKPYYSAGESVWFAGYLVDGMSTRLSPYSKFIYVELIDKGDSVKARYKIQRDSLGFNGNMPLPADLTPGDYHLRAYSWWMQNSGPDFFYQRNIRIGNAIDKSIQSSASYRQMADKQLNADIVFSSDEHIAFGGRRVNYKIFKGGKMIRSRSAAIDQQGHLRLGMDYEPDSRDQYSIQLAFDDPSYTYKRTFFIPVTAQGFDLQFFPEGGNLLNNGFRNIAYKAIGNNGLSVEVEGVAFNQKGDTVATFSSEHKGMGTFSVYLADSVPGKYYAKARVKGTDKYQNFDLPAVVDHGYGLKMLVRNGKVRYEIMAGRNPQVAKLYLLAHERGQLILVLPVNDSVQWHGSIANDKFRPGIVHFLLLDQDGNALSQRLVFVDKPVSDPVVLKSDREVYKTRQQVNASLLFAEKADSLAAGKFSVSVTEDRSVKLDSLAGNIRSGLLLTSDLKGYVEDPAYYLERGALAEHETDLVMLTHGWSRFDVPSILKGKFPEEQYYLEQGQSFSGRVTNILGKGAKDAQVIIMDMKHKQFKIIAADEQGKFVIDRLSFPDSTVFVVQGRSKRGHATVDLTVDSDKFPSIAAMYPFSLQFAGRQVDDYMDVMSQKFHYEGGERVVHLKEVTVSASRKTTDEDNSLYEGMGNPIKSEELDRRFAGRSVLDIVRTYPGVNVMSDLISIRGSRNNPELIIDDMPYPEDDDLVDFLSTINSADVEYVNVLKGTEAALVSHYGGNSGVIIIRFKTGFDISRARPASPGLAIIRPLGYYQPTQFYSPKYVTPEQIANPNPDLRTTIYWNPFLLATRFVPAGFSFFTADRPGSYTITVEGITAEGEPLFLQKKFLVKDN
jgi:hypothetical protein